MPRTAAIVTRFALGVAVVAGLTLAAAPVGAHTGSLFTVVRGDGGSMFSTISGTDAALTPFGPIIPGEFDARGVEIFNETGYVLLEEEIDDETYVPYIATWDHSTGALGPLVELVGDSVNVTVMSVFGLDTTNDGTIIAFARVEVLEGEFPVDYEWVVSIDPVTGVITELVDITGASPYDDSLATDPTTGITYAFVDLDDGTPQYLVLDLVAGTYEPAVDLDEIESAIGPGYIYGADFDTSGTLWFFYAGFLEEGANDGLGRTTAPFSETVGAALVGDADEANEINLAYDPYVAPQLAATGLDVPLVAIIAGALALLGAGAVAVFAGRRRAA